MISRGAREVIRFGFRRNQCFVYCALTEQRHWCLDLDPHLIAWIGCAEANCPIMTPGIEVCAFLINLRLLLQKTITMIIIVQK